jgi:hypothetical protein
MTSLKGIEWGSPEFVKIAKQGESEYEANEIINNSAELIDSLIDFRGFNSENWKQRSGLIGIRDDLTEILGLYDESWEAYE